MTTREEFLNKVRRYSVSNHLAGRSWLHMTGEAGTLVRLEHGMLQIKLPDGTEIVGSLDHLSIAGEGVPVDLDVTELRQVAAVAGVELLSEEFASDLMIPAGMLVGDGPPIGEAEAANLVAALSMRGIRPTAFAALRRFDDDMLAAILMDSGESPQAAANFAEAQAERGPYFPDKGVTRESLLDYAKQCRRIAAKWVAANLKWRSGEPGLQINVDDGGRLDDMEVTARGELVPAAMAVQVDEIMRAGEGIEDAVRAAQAERDCALRHLAATHDRLRQAERQLEIAMQAHRSAP